MVNQPSNDDNAEQKRSRLMPDNSRSTQPIDDQKSRTKQVQFKKFQRKNSPYNMPDNSKSAQPIDDQKSKVLDAAHFMAQENICEKTEAPADTELRVRWMQEAEQAIQNAIQELNSKIDPLKAIFNRTAYRQKVEDRKVTQDLLTKIHDYLSKLKDTIPDIDHLKEKLIILRIINLKEPLTTWTKEASRGTAAGKTTKLYAIANQTLSDIQDLEKIDNKTLSDIEDLVGKAKKYGLTDSDIYRNKIIGGSKQYYSTDESVTYKELLQNTLINQRREQILKTCTADEILRNYQALKDKTVNPTQQDRPQVAEATVSEATTTENALRRDEETLSKDNEVVGSEVSTESQQTEQTPTSTKGPSQPSDSPDLNDP